MYHVVLNKKKQTLEIKVSSFLRLTFGMMLRLPDIIMMLPWIHESHEFFGKKRSRDDMFNRSQCLHVVGCHPKNRKHPKMDGLFHGKPCEQMDDLGGPPLFLETPSWSQSNYMKSFLFESWLAGKSGPKEKPGRESVINNWTLTPKESHVVPLPAFSKGCWLEPKGWWIDTL